MRSRWAGVTYRVLGLERADAVTMQCGIFDWPAFLSQAVHPKSSISAEIMVMRLALLHMFYRYLLMRCGIIPAKVDTLVHFAKDRVAFLGRNRWRRHCSNQRGIRCGALAGARRQWLRNRLRPNDLGRSRHYCSTQRSILHRASFAGARWQRLRNRLRLPDFGRSRQHCSTQRGILRRASFAGARRQLLRNRLRLADFGRSRQHCEVAPFQWTVCQLAVYFVVMAACMSAS